MKITFQHDVNLTMSDDTVSTSNREVSSS